MDSSSNSASMHTLTVDREPHQQQVAAAAAREDGDETFIVYRYRWLVLGLFCLSEAANAMMWVTFSPISNLVQDYFGQGSYYGSTTSVNMLANIFLVLYGPGTLLSVYCMKHMKLKSTLVLAGSLTLLGALIRYIAALNNDSLGHGNVYILMMIGQALAAITQPMYLNSPPALSSIWFAVNERDTATTIGAMCSPIGNAIGQLIPALLVSGRRPSDDVDDDSQDSVRGMPDLMLTQLLMCILPLVLTAALFRDAPPTPPSKSTQLKNDRQQREHDLHLSSTGSSNSSSDGKGELWSQLLLSDDLVQLQNNKNYLVLFCAFSIGVGFFNSLMTLLNQLIAPFGYSNDDSGTFGAVFIVCGLIGAGVAGKLMERTRAYRTILKVGVGLCVCTTVFLVAMMFSNNYWPLLIAFGLLGLSILPLLPVMMENCAECTYPVPEDLSMGIMFVGSNILGLGFIFGLQFLIDTPSFGPPPLLPSNAFIVAIIVIAAVIVYFYQGEYRRLERESLLDRLPDRLHEDSSSLLTPLTGYRKTAPPSLSIPTVFHPSSTRVSSSSTDFDLHSQDRDRDRLGSSGSKQLIDSEFISASSSINLWAHNSQATAATSHNHSLSGTSYSQHSKQRHNNMNPIQVLVNVVDADRGSIYSERKKATK